MLKKLWAFQINNLQFLLNFKALKISFALQY